MLRIVYKIDRIQVIGAAFTMIGQKLRGRYRLDTRLGGGAQGEVYLAFDEEINRRVAIKILKTSNSETATGTESQERVRREAIATAMFEHVNVVRVFDFQVTEEGIPFLVMEYLKGETGEKLPLPLEPQLLELLVRQVCAALTNAHQQGLVHRDLKPANLMLVDQGKTEQRFVILDLGLAKLTDPGKVQLQFTYSGAGTPLYMSPEQVNGETVDFRSDIYSFGTMLFEMLTGCRPFDSSSASLGLLLRAVCFDPPPTLASARPEGTFSPELQALVADCLEKDPARRPQSLQEVAERFREAFQLPGHVISKRKRPRRWAGISTLLALPLLAGLGWYSRPNWPDWGKSLAGQPVQKETTQRGSALPVQSPPKSVVSAAAPVQQRLVAEVKNTTKPVATVLPLPVISKFSLAAIPNCTVAEGEECVVRASVVEPSSVRSKVLFALAGDIPAGAMIDSDGHFHWRPTEEQGPQRYKVVISGHDMEEPARKSDAEFEITVTEVNQPPVFDKIPNQEAVAGRELSFKINASDSDLPQNRLTFQLVKGAPVGAEIRGDSGLFTWTPSAEQANRVYPVSVTVVDDFPTSAPVTSTFIVTVNEAPPVADKIITNSIGMQLVRIEAGEFLMGSPDDEKGGDKRERPQHLVVFEKPFLMGAYEVTQAEYERLTHETPSFFKGPGTQQSPVEQVSWHDANRFCTLLSELPEEKLAGRRYRLPTEAEWEYACRAGSKTPYPTGDELSSEHIWFKSDRPAPVGKPRLPNAWGVYDMQGNVWEWCSDIYDLDYYKTPPPKVAPPGPKGPTLKNPKGLRVLRGGGFLDTESWLFRSAFRTKADPAEATKEVGFRVVCEF